MKNFEEIVKDVNDEIESDIFIIELAIKHIIMNKIKKNNKQRCFIVTLQEIKVQDITIKTFHKDAINRIIKDSFIAGWDDVKFEIYLENELNPHFVFYKKGE